MFDPLRENPRKDQPAPGEGRDQDGWHIQIPERWLGLDARQRFIVAVFLFLITIVIGVTVLLATGKIMPF